MYKLIEQFYKDNYSTLVKRLNRRAGGRENAEDVLQEAFLRALKYGGSFNPERQELGAWFNTIMNNTLVAHQRIVMLDGMSTSYDEAVHEECYECDAEEKLLIGEIIEHIEERDERHRNILHLFFICGYKVKEVQEVVGGGYKGIQMLIHRFKLTMIEEYDDGFECG